LLHYKVLCLFLMSLCSLYSQKNKDSLEYSHFIAGEILFGKLMPPNTGFPEVKIQKSFFLNFGKNNQIKNQEEWVYRLNNPKTGLGFGYSEFGNTSEVGRAYLFIPYAEFDYLKNRRLKLLAGLGASYHNVQYDILANPLNKGVTTDFSWAFRMSLFYEIIKWETSALRIGLNYVHHSNGHVKLPNQGFNSFMVGISYENKYNREGYFSGKESSPKLYIKNSYNYFSARFGIGQNTLSLVYNDKKEVYSLALSYGKVVNKTYKFGFGMYYRMYEHYYDYIKNEGEIVLENYPLFLENPFGYATNFGFFGSGELLLNHFGVEFEMGLNVYKPFYKVDWILNKGYNYIEYNDGDPYVMALPGELDWYYELKRSVSGRLGLKYYFVGTQKTPEHNFYIAAHINANLGQADFSELSLGYVYGFNYKK